MPVFGSISIQDLLALLSTTDVSLLDGLWEPSVSLLIMAARLLKRGNILPRRGGIFPLFKGRVAIGSIDTEGFQSPSRRLTSVRPYRVDKTPQQVPPWQESETSHDEVSQVI